MLIDQKRTPMSHFRSKKSLLFIILFFLSFQYASSQTSTETSSISKDRLLFERGVQLQELVDEDLDLDEAIKDKNANPAKSAYASEIKRAILGEASQDYEELMSDFPESDLFNYALTNQAFVKLGLEDTVEAEKLFLATLKSKAGEAEITNAGSASQTDPYADNKNKAAKMLTEISLANRQYQAAYTYLEEIKKYKPDYNTDTARDADEMYVTGLYASCYVGLKQYQKAYDILLPKLLKTDLTDNSELVDIAYEALLKKYKNEELKRKYEQAFKNYQVEKNAKTGELNYYITFLNKKIPLASKNISEHAAGNLAAEVDKIYKGSRFYTRLQVVNSDKKP
jgi:hypothetical protein